MKRISLEAANTIIAAAFKKGAELGLNPLSIAVLDAGGNPIAFQRQDGASNSRFQIASGKAAGALALGVSSRTIEKMSIDRPHFIGAFVSQTPFGLIPAAGGLIAKDADGNIVGAVGVTGDSSDNDELCTVAGIEAANLTAQM
ncbi:MAG: heme-binding protein [Alphaproteobacteria bacterium]|nr:heme-binding protein [Alphaproteobacteria bacterium]